MPFITNTKNDEFGHAQTQRDIEYLYMLLGAGETQINDSGMSQEIGDDTVDGSPLAGRGGGGGNVVNNAITTTTYFMIVGNGNLVTTIGGTNIYGLKYPAANVTEVPTVIPPAGQGAAPDGLSKASLELTPGVITTVWVGLRLQPGGAGPVFDDIGPIDIFYNTPLCCLTYTLMPLSGNPAILTPVYRPFRF